MTKPPNGLQRHAVWSMDGRTWIEPAIGEYSKMREWAIAKGYCKIIPQDKLQEFVNSL